LPLPPFCEATTMVFMLSRFREFAILRIHCFMKSKILEAHPSGSGCGQATMTIGPSAGDGSTELQYQ